MGSNQQQANHYQPQNFKNINETQGKLVYTPNSSSQNIKRAKPRSFSSKQALNHYKKIQKQFNQISSIKNNKSYHKPWSVVSIHDNDRKNEIKVETFHLSCRSSSGPYLFQKESNYAGLIVYSIGNFPAKQRIGNNIYPGYVLVKKTSEMQSYQSKEGQVHGTLCRFFFGEDPSILKSKYNVVMSGFAIKSGELKYNSATLNTGTNYQDKQKKMSQIQQPLLFLFLLFCEKSKNIFVQTLQQLKQKQSYKEGLKYLKA